MLEIQQIEIDDSVKPAIEWIGGKAVQKADADRLARFLTTGLSPNTSRLG